MPIGSEFINSTSKINYATYSANIEYLIFWTGALRSLLLKEKQYVYRFISLRNQFKALNLVNIEIKVH